MTVILYKKLSKEYNNVLYVNSLYSLSLYTYIMRGELSDTLVIIENDIDVSNIIGYLQNLLILDSSKKPLSFFDLIKVKFNFNNEFREIIRMIRNKKIYGHDHLRYSKIFPEMNVIEDGLSNYNYTPMFSDYIKRFFLSLICVNYNRYGFFNKSKNVYLTREFKTKRNIYVFLKRDDYIKALLDLLNGAFCNKFMIKDKVSILLTQPISEDGLVSEDEKIEIYRSIIINSKLKILIKPHPREITNYKQVFNDVHTLDKSTLSETLYCNENIEYYITLYSSFNSTDKDNNKLIRLGTRFNQELSNVLGVIEPSDKKYELWIK